MDSFSKIAITAGIVMMVIGWSMKFARRRLKYRNLPGPPHNFFLGHIPIMARHQMKYPMRLHPHMYLLDIQQENNLPPVFYLDVWPFGSEMMVIIDPETAQEVTVNHSLPKSPDMYPYIHPLAGEKNLVTMENPEWKKWRAIFNPGFSARHLTTLIPGMVDSVMTFRQILGEMADGQKVFRLEEAATKLTFDIIGKVTIDHDLDSQRADNELISALRDQLNTLPVPNYSLNPKQLLNPILRPIQQRRNTERMNAYLSKILEERYAKYDASKPKTKSVLDLALESYFAWQRENGMTGTTKIDATFKAYAVDQIKIFIFAGHDTTSSAICYACHLLSQHPVKLAKLRAEHDAVFGPDPTKAAQQIRDKPHLINALPYTMAVIRETLRTYAPASSTRLGQKGYYIKHPTTGQMLPTEGILIWPMANAMHRSPALWGPDVGDFVPERFLPENAAALPKHAFRPFEMGPRNCIGQELALIEARLALVLVAREFDFAVTYDLDDIKQLRTDGSVWSQDKSLQYTGGSYKGDKAFPVLIATAKPNEGMPARVTRRKHVAL